MNNILLTLKKIFLISICIILLTCIQTYGQETSDVSNPKSVSISEFQKTWQKLIDSGDYDKAHKACSECLSNNDNVIKAEAHKCLANVQLSKSSMVLLESNGTGGGELGVAGGLGYTQLPEEGETRGGQAVEEMAGAALGMGTGAVLGKAIRGLNKSKEAQKLLDEGVYLTPGAAAQNPVISGIENAMEVTPFLARGTKKAREKMTDSWNMDILNKAAPEGVTITDIGTKGAKQLEDAYESAYADAWRGAGSVDIDTAADMITSIENVTKRFGKKDRRVLNNIIADLEDYALEGGKNSFKRIDETLRNEMKTSGGKRPALTKELNRIRQQLRASAGADIVEKLKPLDAKYPTYLTARDATGRAKQTGGVFTPAQLTSSSGKVGRRKAEVGEAPLQREADLARETVGKKVGGQPLEWFRRLAAATPNVVPMQTAGRAVMGQTAPQRFLQQQLLDPQSRQAQILRQYSSPAALGYGLNMDENY